MNISKIYVVGIKKLSDNIKPSKLISDLAIPG